MLIRLFNRLFTERYNTRLEGGGEEPLYEPARAEDASNRIIFTRDYFASALHEVAHWCVAGPERRRQVDYGYWYAPDGRNQEQQRAFERVEVKPQALEWVFSRAAGFRFRISADNLDGEVAVSDSFKRAVRRQAQRCCEQGLPARAAEFADGLMSTFGNQDALRSASYRLEDI